MYIGTCQGRGNSLEMSASPWLYQVIIVAMSAFLPTALAQVTATAPIKHSHRHNQIETERERSSKKKKRRKKRKEKKREKHRVEVEKLAFCPVSFPLSLSHFFFISAQGVNRCHSQIRSICVSAA